MLALQYLKNEPKIGLKQLVKIISSGITECTTFEEKRRFGLEALKMYDYKNDDEMNDYLKYGHENPYYSNLIHKDENILIKNIVWNPSVKTPPHGHN
mmetsp:Transcript_25744/g.25562  ORF Transcript_25744/g.25562 Transcript_25744/m.25562 type:complete len:97 (-) Transcript_25744:438-728(-)